jgi:superfamily II DNA or RNA helicase
MTIALRPYQSEAVQRILESRQRGDSSGILVLPTGTGKTATCAAAVASLGQECLVLVHREELLDQWVRAFADVDRTCGTIHRSTSTEPIRVAMVWSLHERRRAETPAPHGIVIVDECHHAQAPTYRAILEWAQGCYVLGTTATPYRLDGLPLADIFGTHPLYQLDVADAIRDGWLVRPLSMRISLDLDLSGVGYRAGDFVAEQISQAVDSPQLNALVAATIAEGAAERRTIVYCAGVAHAQHICECLRARGIVAGWISGEHAPTERAETIRAYSAGELRALCNCAVLTEGFDDPLTDCIAMVRPTASRGLYVQCVGRGLRVADGKRDCLILDFFANDHSLRLQNCERALLGFKSRHMLELAAQRRDATPRDVLTTGEQILYEHQQAVDIVARYPLKWKAVDRTPRWARELMSLDGYEPDQKWQERAASGKQIELLARLGLEVDAALADAGERFTCGMASHLIDRAITLDRANPEPPTSRQAYALRCYGYDRAEIDAMTKREASRIIGARRR